MKIVSVVGARPQFIKVAVVLSAFERLNREYNRRLIHSVLVHTGQHYDANMSDVFFEELEIPEPDYHLGIGSGTHGEQTGKMLEALEKVFLRERPDAVLVYGDTNSTFAGALAAAKLHIPVGHVEAGLRSYNRKMPEEINRVLTDHVSMFLFCPSLTACRNLVREGFEELVSGGELCSATDFKEVSKGGIGKNLISHSRPIVLNVGDVMVDALQEVAPALHGSDHFVGFPYRAGEYLVLTLHRAENVDDKERFVSILEAMQDSPLPIVLPVHPRTRSRLRTFGIQKIVANFPFDAREPFGYREMLGLVKNAAMVLTDSGGLQKEAFLLGVPCVTLRTETEWVETVEAGWNALVPYPERGFLHERLAWAQEVRSLERPQLYGDGYAGDRIATFFSIVRFHNS